MKDCDASLQWCAPLVPFPLSTCSWFFSFWDSQFSNCSLQLLCMRFCHVFCWQYLHLFFCWLLSQYQRLYCHFLLPCALELNIGVFYTKCFCNAVRYSSSVAMNPVEDIRDYSAVSQSFSFCSFFFLFFCYLSLSSPLPLRICGDSRPFLSANYHGCCGRSSPGWRHRKGVAFCPNNNVVGFNWANRVVLAQFPRVREARRFLPTE